ncbi:uncharacterized protein Dip518_000024 [Parelusimicrobium proximum]|uniref:TM0106 family RecB-like putative nuclease n=1 Tax=Parelusimicrobium proximum TaxID=3228953 RepID=UPI003D179818
MITDELFTKFSAGRTPDSTDFNASKMFALLEDPFGLWCNYHAPREEMVEEINRYENLKIKTDKVNKDDWVLTNFPDAVKVRAENESERFKLTLRYMSEGKTAIITPLLWNLPAHTYGSLNLLVRSDDAASVFGDFHYKIIQLKRAHDIKEHYILQVALLNKILGDIQGYTPYFARVILKKKETTVDYHRHLNRLEAELEKWKQIRDGSLEPEPHKPPKAAASPWRVYANKVVTERKDLLMLPHLSPDMRRMLRDAGIKNTDDAAHAGLEKLRTILEEPHATESYYNSVAYLHNKPVQREEGVFPPERKKHNLYFDFEATETFTKDGESFVYLIGIWDKEENKFVSFVAKDKTEEEKIFADFFGYIQDFDDTILYHWTAYEVQKMNALKEKYPAIKDKLAALVKICLDLKIIMNKAFYLPSPSFSLKAAAPAFGFKWRQGDCGAMDSMVYYTNWTKTGNQDLLDKVLKYNEDDCYAMLYLDEHLEKAEVIKTK